MKSKRKKRKIEAPETLIWLTVLKSVEPASVVPEIKDSIRTKTKEWTRR
jgi:hypothetical protein